MRWPHGGALWGIWASGVFGRIWRDLGPEVFGGGKWRDLPYLAVFRERNGTRTKRWGQGVEKSYP